MWYKTGIYHNPNEFHSTWGLIIDLNLFFNTLSSLLTYTTSDGQSYCSILIKSPASLDSEIHTRLDNFNLYPTDYDEAYTICGYGRLTAENDIKISMNISTLKQLQTQGEKIIYISCQYPSLVKLLTRERAVLALYNQYSSQQNNIANRKSFNYPLGLL